MLPMIWEPPTLNGGKEEIMIYSNTEKTVIEKTLPWGVLKCVFMGEEGRGRKY